QAIEVVRAKATSCRVKTKVIAKLLAASELIRIEVDAKDGISQLTGEVGESPIAAARVQRRDIAGEQVPPECHPLARRNIEPGEEHALRNEHRPSSSRSFNGRQVRSRASPG